MMTRRTGVISRFQKELDKAIGMLLNANWGENRHSRIRETAVQAAAIGRPILLTANEVAEDFGITEEIWVCMILDTPTGHGFLSTLISHSPGSIPTGLLQLYRVF